MILALLLLVATRPVPPLQDTLRLSLNPLWAVGGSEDTVFSFSRLFPGQIASGPEGDLLVIDSDRARVLLLTPNGRLRRTIGRRGAGPGELELPTTVAVTPKGVILVYDAAKRALIRYTATGHPLAPIRLADQGLVQQVYADNESTYVVSTISRDSAQLLRLTGSRTVRLFAAPLPARRPVDGRRCGLIGHERAPFFAPRLLWTAGGYGVAVNSDGGFALRILPEGSGQTLTRPAVPAQTDGTQLQAFYGDSEPIWVGGTAKPCLLPVASLARDAGIASTVPAYERLLTMGNKIWALRMVPKGSPHLADIYEPRRGYIGTVILGNATPVAILPPSRLILLTQDEDETPVLRAYSVSGLP